MMEEGGRIIEEETICMGEEAERQETLKSERLMRPKKR